MPRVGQALQGGNLEGLGSFRDVVDWRLAIGQALQGGDLESPRNFEGLARHFSGED